MIGFFPQRYSLVQLMQNIICDKVNLCKKIGMLYTMV